MAAESTVYVKSLYAISDGIGNVKFGVAKDPCRRIKEMQTGNAHPLQFLFELESLSPGPRTASTGAYWLEHQLHQLLVSQRMTGEWFAIDYHAAYSAMQKVRHWASESAWLSARRITVGKVIVHREEPDHIWYWPTSDVYERGLVE